MAARKSSLQSKVPFLIIEILGLALATYMFMISAELIGGKMPCARSKWIACESAVKGPFSHIGPFGVAAMGVIYYVIHLALTAGLRDRSAQIMKVLLVAGGLVFVAWLRALEIVWLKKICPWCWGVAVLTLIHAGISYGLAVPPLKRLRAPGIFAVILLGFLILVGLVTAAELGVKTGHMLLNQGSNSGSSKKSAKSADDDQSVPEATPKPTKTPRVVAATQSPTPAVATTPAASPSPRPQALPDEPEVIDTPETRILKNRGWRHAASGSDVIKIIKARTTILLLVYDPYCNDCHQLITTVLDSEEAAGVPVLKIAIQDSMLTGDSSQSGRYLSEMVGKDIPVLMLFRKDGEEANVPWKHTGSTITKEQLTGEVQKALSAAPAQQP